MATESTESKSRSAKVIAFANQKGGIGKTTSAINVAAELGHMGYKVLLIDLDPQGNTTSGVGANKRGIKSTVYDVLISRADIGTACVKTIFENLWLLPANMSLAGAEFELVASENREERLRQALQSGKDSFDYILIDCPPSLGILTINALVAADGVVIPMQCEFFALEGLSQLTMTIKRVKELYNPSIDIIGILITMYNGRLNLSLQVLEEIKKYFRERMFRTPVPRAIRLSEAPSYGKPIRYYDRYSKGAEAYADIAQELAQRTQA